MTIEEIEKIKGSRFITQITLEHTDDKIKKDIDSYIFARYVGFSRKELKKHYGH